MAKEEFTPMENLLIEVLIARARLGERIWTFDRGSLRAAKALEEAGWISTLHGAVENSYRAGLTDKGRARWLSYGYSSPLKVKGSREIVEEARAIRSRLDVLPWEDGS